MHDPRSATPPTPAPADDSSEGEDDLVEVTDDSSEGDGPSDDGAARGLADATDAEADRPIEFEVPPAPDATRSPPRSARAGQLTPEWRMMLGLAWAGSIFAYAAVWQASVQLGIGLWWVGPRSLPTPLWVKMIPFIAPTAMLFAIGFNVRRLPFWGLLGSAVAALVAIPDFSRSTGLAVTELVIAGALALVSAMSFTGLYRVAASDAGDSVERS